MTERYLNLVKPLAQKATAMRRMETAGSCQNVSSAVIPLIGDTCLRRGDVDSLIEHSTQAALAPPGVRTSKMEIRTTTIRTTPCAAVQSADTTNAPHADFSFSDLVKAYFDCRKNKRNTASALKFEERLETNLRDLYDELIDGSYQPGQSICFVITRPKHREVWAADFRDRIVHHLFYNHVSPRFYASFIADSCACIPKRGTLYAAKRLESKIRSITENWAKTAFYLKCDLSNFFVAINKQVVFDLIKQRVSEPWWQWLAGVILFHDPRLNFEMRSTDELANRVPAHKRLVNQTSDKGLPIGNLSSQFFANIYLDVLDQHIKHKIGAKHYIRYVDDFILLHKSPQWLNAALADITAFLPATLDANLNPKKTILQPIDRGVDFVGQVIRPWRRHTRKRTINEALRRIKRAPDQDLFETANSYFGLIGQATARHHHRTKLANVLRIRGYTINQKISKTYRRNNTNYQQ